MTISIVKPGLLSSFQDLGRLGYQHQGIPAAGAMDARSHRLASLLVGNDPARTASLEITLTGPSLRFDAAACFALCGANLGARLNGRPVPNNRPLLARAGDMLAFNGAPGADGPGATAPPSGLRAYLAIHGGYALAVVMQSESTYLRSGFGGYHGRALAKGDVIPLRSTLDTATQDALEAALWDVRVYLPAAIGQPPRATVRALPGRQWEAFTEAARADFGSAAFTVTPQSERMGYRLQGPVLAMAVARQMLSEATCFGTVQVPADGAPIVLMADRQTTGGYPKIAQVASVDLPVLAQTPPGAAIRFQMIALEEAQRLDSEREVAFDRLRAALQPLRDVYARYLAPTP
jgi:antagonist of KipI